MEIYGRVTRLQVEIKPAILRLLRFAYFAAEAFSIQRLDAAGQPTLEPPGLQAD
jgi:hypothetical protein